MKPHQTKFGVQLPMVMIEGDGKTTPVKVSPLRHATKCVYKSPHCDEEKNDRMNTPVEYAWHFCMMKTAKTPDELVLCCQGKESGNQNTDYTKTARGFAIFGPVVPTKEYVFRLPTENTWASLGGASKSTDTGSSSSSAEPQAKRSRLM
ncbi:unnamed protein product [Amoebophrya sp. A25]|nr:unnamed protein product [Amoebophrya sp. A25]|eukprot:GSA25T00009787001.1